MAGGKQGDAEGFDFRSHGGRMRRLDGLESFSPPGSGLVVTMGNFDGVHRGHMCLIETARREATAIGAPTVAITFDPHPLAVVAPDRAPRRLTTLGERLDLLEAAGLDATIVLRADAALLATPADAFLNRLVERCRPRVIVEGPTFNFGRGRAGSVETLREHAARLGYRAVIVDELFGRELGGNPPINSSAIRDAVADGRIEDANALLGRTYRIVGVVGSGQHRGAGLGFPTANLESIPHLLPELGVYAGIAQMADGIFFPAAINVGPQPTFDQQAARVEAFLLDFGGGLRGSSLGLHFLARLRGQQKFATPQALVAQLHEDVRRVREFGPRVAAMRAAGVIGLG